MEWNQSAFWLSSLHIVSIRWTSGDLQLPAPLPLHPGDPSSAVGIHHFPCH